MQHFQKNKYFSIKKNQNRSNLILFFFDHAEQKTSRFREVFNW